MGTYCRACVQDFETEEDLQKHLTSPAHRCEDCNRSFAAGHNAVRKHLRDSRRHQKDGSSGSRLAPSSSVPLRSPPVEVSADTPLDQFFRSFPTFDYDSRLSPSESYNSLRRFNGWRKGDAKADDAWSRYQQALMEEVELWFGKESDINAWHVLCRAIGVTPPPTIEDCKKIVRGTHVNIVDLIEWGRNGDNGRSVRVFKKKLDLVTYTRETGKFFPQSSVTDGEGDTNIVLRHLLRHLTLRV